MSLDETLAAIDAVTGCQHCGGPLGGSPSADFCSEDCQKMWTATRCADGAHGVLRSQIETALDALQRALCEMVQERARAFQKFDEALRHCFAPLQGADPEEESPQQRALRLQRSRNTGPNRERYPKRGRG